MLQDLLANAKKHWKTTLFGLMAASFAAMAVTPNLDDMTPGQVFFAYGTCLAVAVKGLLSADAPKASDAPPAPKA
jgi:hypothetical protein